MVDDHRSFAEMLVAALDGMNGLRCVGMAHSSAAEGIDLVRRLQPDMVVMDIQLPGEDGLAATRKIREVAPDALVAVLTAHTAPDWISRAAQAGASAFIPKNGSLEELLGVLVTAGHGHMVVAPSAFAHPPLASDPAPSETPALSRREIDVLRLLAGGTAVKDSGTAAGVSQSTRVVGTSRQCARNWASAASFWRPS